MTPERWRQVEEIFQAAVDLLPEERARYLSQACATDTDLKRNVEVLLSQHDSAGDLLEHSLYGQTDGSVFESFIEEKDPMLGRRLGSYRIDARSDAAAWAQSTKRRAPITNSTNAPP